MKQFVIAAVRTGIQALVGALIAVPFVAQLGIDADALVQLLDAVAIGLITILMRWLETQFPWLTPIFSLGLTKEGPNYEAKHLA